MLNEFSRTELLLGKEAIEKLKNSKVAIFGLGGVGSYVVEGLVRSGIGNFVLIDDDTVCLTNINRQIIATRKTVGKAKVDVTKERIQDINPKAKIITHQTFYLPNNKENILTDDIDYIIDAIDTVTAKIDLVQDANAKNIPIISSMGTGNKLNPTMLEVTDISKTSICPLAKVMRAELRKRGIKNLKVVYSKEPPLIPYQGEESGCKTNCICTNKDRTCANRRAIPGSVSFVPSVAGLIIAGEVVKDIINISNKT